MTLIGLFSCYMYLHLQIETKGLVYNPKISFSDVILALKFSRVVKGVSRGIHPIQTVFLNRCHSKIDQITIKNRQKSRSGGLRCRFGGVLGRLGRSKASLEASWTVLEASWRRLGGVLEASWAVFGLERWPTWLELGPQNGAKIN